MKSFILLVCLIATAHVQAQWIEQNLNFESPHNCLQISMVDANVAWVTGFTGNFATTGPWQLTFDDHTFSRTVDGENWQMGAFAGDFNGLASDLSAVDANTAFIAYNDFSAQNNVQIHKTTDGGQTWDTLHVGMTNWINFVYAFDADRIIAMGDPDTEGWQVFHSDDGGETWERVNPFLLPVDAGEFGPYETYAVDGDHIWFSSSTGRVFHSEDRGDNWEYNSSPVPANAGLPTYPDAIACRQEGVCIQSFTNYTDLVDPTPYHRGYLYRTPNHGASWEDITPADNPYCVANLQYIPGSEGVLIATFRHNNFEGPFETRLSYDDGDSWLTVDTIARVYHVDFVDPDNGYATEYENDGLPTVIYRYDGSPLLGMFKPENLQADIRLFPNPALDFLSVSVESELTGDYWILVNDMEGRLLQKHILPATGSFQQTLDISQLPDGAYALTVSHAKGSKSLTFIKH